MNKKKILSAKKNFIKFLFLLVFSFWIFFNSENIFAEKNKDLEKKLNEIQSEIKKLDITKNLCDDLKPKKKVEDKKYSDKVKDDYSEVFYPENYWISKKWIAARDDFLEKVSVWWLQEVIDSFTIQFSWNYCFQRDLQKIDKILYSSIKYWAKLAENCQTWSVLKIKEIIWKNDKKWNPISWIKLLKKYFKSEDKNKGFFKEDLYWATPVNCKEDSITDAMNKIKDLKKKVKDLTSWEWAFFDNFSFDINYKKIEKQAKADAKNYLLSNLNATLQWLWITAIFDEKWEWENIFETITKIAKNINNKQDDIDKIKKKNNEVVLKWNIKNLLNTAESKKNDSKYANIATKFFEKNKTLNNVEEDASNKIVANLLWLEIDISVANWNKKELDEVIKSPWWLAAKSLMLSPSDEMVIKHYNNIKNEWTWSEELKTLKNFILKVSSFLDGHNEKVWTTSSNISLTCDKKIDKFSFK